VLPPNINVEHKYSQSRIITEELRWVHGGKGQVAQQDRVKTTMTGEILKEYLHVSFVHMVVKICRNAFLCFSSTLSNLLHG
jgi:hypothetical protein